MTRHKVYDPGNSHKSIHYLPEKDLLKALQKAIHNKDVNIILKLAEQNRSNPDLPPSVVAILDSTLRSVSSATEARAM